MEQRQLGGSDLRVPVLSFGAGTFGGRGELFGNWGSSGVAEAARLVSLCLDHGVTMFDSADVYSDGASEEVLGQAIRGRRDQVLVSTKAGLAGGTSGAAIRRAVEDALRRLGTDRIDLFQLHAHDAAADLDDTMDALAGLRDEGKIRHAGVSNFSGWQLLKAMTKEPRFVSHQVYYSLVGRDYEWDLMPLGLDQHVSAIVWSPLGWGRLTGKVRRGQPLPGTSRLHRTADAGPPVDDELLYRVVDELDRVAAETGRAVPQVAINWLLTRPTVASVVIGARTEEQLRQNLGSVGWALTRDQLERLDRASATTPPYPHYPYYRQEAFRRLSPPPGLRTAAAAPRG